ncbi:MAG: DUF11 domain-containing protein [Fimbriimonadaceae bacterium]|nr:DUF11 domain-containing protein [Fimbriimonadaceae bacterium]
MRRLSLLLAALAWSVAAPAATFSVTNTADSGAGSFAAALGSANADTAADIIVFNLSGAGPHRIVSVGAVVIEQPVTIDGTSQPGYSGTPRIEFNSVNTAGWVVNTAAAGTVIKGLSLVNSGNDRLVIYAPQTVVKGCWFGVGADGQTQVANGSHNIVVGANDVQIGGTGPAEGNVLVRAGRFGLFIGGWSRALVYGNLIGVGPSGIEAMPNASYGIYLWGATDCRIGGPADGQGNVISGNAGSGLATEAGSDLAGTRIQGNYVGVAADGRTALPNAASGMYLTAIHAIIGGAAVGEGNVVSGNGQYGIVSTGATLYGNFVGTDASGTLAVPNAEIGVVCSTGTHLGGSLTGQGNLISGNGSNGVHLSGPDCVIQGNRIGTNAAGDLAIPNRGSGIIVSHGEYYANLIGGEAVIGGDGTLGGAGNLISGNERFGIEATWPSPRGTTIRGNYIGTNLLGTAAVGNSLGGIIASYSGNTIGGTNPAHRNVISGNFENGITLGTFCDGAVQGNYLGTDYSGTRALGNLGCGIYCAADNVTLGVVAANSRQSLAAGGNLISGNGAGGIQVYARTRIAGNLIGTDLTGSRAVPNQVAGILVGQVVYLPQIGGDRDVDRNLISGNNGDGVKVNAVISGNTLELTNNWIGLQADGTTPLGNSSNGVLQLGGTVRLSRNRIAYNGQNGVWGRQATTSENRQSLSIGEDNEIWANEGWGIHLGDHPLQLNDGLETAGQPNHGIDWPELSSASTVSEGVRVTGSFHGQPGTIYRLAFFTNANADISGHGEGQHPAAFWDILSDSQGDITIDHVLPAANVHGPVVTATAFRPDYGTSEFSNAVSADAVNLAIDKSAAAATSYVGQNLVYTIRVTNQGELAQAGVTVTDQLPAGLTYVSATVSQGTVSEAGGTVAANLGTLAAGAEATVSLTVTCTQRGNVSNTAAVTVGGGAPRSDQATVNVLGPPAAPVLTSPGDSSNVEQFPLDLHWSASDEDGGNLRYKVELLRDGAVVHTFDQTGTVTGGVFDAPQYASGESAGLRVDSLAAGTWQWRVTASDGTGWSAASALRTLVVAAQTWQLATPIGNCVQLPVFEAGLQLSGAPAGTTLQYRLEIARQADFSGALQVYDQTLGQGLWSADQYEAGEAFKLWPNDTTFDLGTSYYWRVQAKVSDATGWVGPSPVSEFHVVRGAVLQGRPRHRFGVPVSYPLELYNPTERNIDFLIQMTLTPPEGFGGSAKLYDPAGTVVDDLENILTEDVSYLTDALSPGRHVFRLEVTLTPAAGTRAARAGRPLPVLLVIAGKFVIGMAVGYALEKSCEAATRKLLQDEHGLSEDEAKDLLEATTEAAKQTGQSAGEAALKKGAEEYLKKKGKEQLAKKLFETGLKAGARTIPFASIAIGLINCIQGIASAAKTDQKVQSEVVASLDPNEKIGLSGTNGFVHPSDLLPYRINFENKATATAAAQVVTVTDSIDSDLNLNSLVFTGCGFGTHTVTPATDSNSLSEDIDLRPSRDVVVQVRGHVDPETRLLTVTFRGVVPGTDLLDDDGFLPPNVTSPQGEGFCSYEIRMPDGIASGTVITNTARIVFDANAPIDTAEVRVTVDGTAPSSAVSGVASSRDAGCGCGTSSGTLPLSFSADDDTAGVQETELWYHGELASTPLGRSQAVGGRTFELHGTAPADATRIDFPARFGYRYRFYTVARDAAGNTETPPDQPDLTTTGPVAPPFAAGLRLVSIPLQPETADPRVVFNLATNGWARYNPTNSGWVRPNADADGFSTFANAAAVPGRGYFLRLSEAVTPTLSGPLPDETQRYGIPLAAGWNLVGNPWLRPLTWSLDQIQVRLGETTQTLAAADAAGIVESYGWLWLPDAASPHTGRYVLLYDAAQLPGVTGSLGVWEGCFILAHQACTLLLPPPVQPVGRRAAAPAGTWSFGLQALTNAGSSEVRLGVANGDTPRAALPPDPPGGAPAVRLASLRDGRRQAVDLTTNLLGARWELELTWPADRAVGDVVLAWPDLRHVPPGVELLLEDPTTGARRSLRTTVGWRLARRDGETVRQLRLLAVRGAGLQVSNLLASTTRGRGVSLSYALSAPAETRLLVVSAGGRTIRELPGGSRTAGAQVQSWDGRDDSGRPVPAGVYRLTLVAWDATGRQSRVVQVVTVR